jgi:hypothetical protein
VQDVSFAKTPEAAADGAREKLIARVCQGTPCADLAARAAIWKTGEAKDGGRCAMAVLEARLIDEWRQSQSARALHKELAQKLTEVLPQGGKPTKVAIGRLSPGLAAPVETFVRAQLTQALSSMASAALVAAPHKGAATIDVDVVERAEQQRAILDVTASVTRPDGTVKAIGVTVPRAVVPIPVAESQELTVRVTATCEKKTGAGFQAVSDCAQTPLVEGDRLKLEVAPSSSAYVYVMAYNSRGQFQMLYPAPDEPNQVTGSASLPAGDWLVLDDVGNVTEHLVIVAARARQSHLELLRGVDVPPRTGAHDDDKLVATRSFLGEVRSRGFDMKKVAAGAARAAPPGGAAPVVERGPGVAAVELAIAHR